MRFDPNMRLETALGYARSMGAHVTPQDDELLVVAAGRVYLLQAEGQLAGSAIAEFLTELAWGDLRRIPSGIPINA